MRLNGEVLVAEVIATYMPQRFEVVDQDPVLVIEHDEPKIDGRGRRGKPTYDPCPLHELDATQGLPRRSGTSVLSEPNWRQLPDHEDRELLGDEADDDHPEATYNDRVNEFDE